MNDESHADEEAKLPTSSSSVPGKISSVPTGVNGALAADYSHNGATHSSAAEILPLLETLLHRWRWLLIGGTTGCVLGLIVGMIFWKTSYTAPAQLIRYESPNAEEVFGVRQAAPQTLPTILQSPELLQRVSAQAKPPVSAEALAAGLRVMPQHDSDIVVVAVTGQNPQATVNLVNLYAREAVRFMQHMQANAANEVVQFADKQLNQVESEIAAVNRQAQNLPAGTSTAVAPQTSDLIEKIQSARADLADLLARYTDAHPLVQAKRAEIAALESELTTQTKTTSDGATNAAAFASSDPEILRGKLSSLENARLTLLGREQTAQALAANPPGYCQLLAPATEKDLVRHGRGAKTLFLTAFMSLLGFAGTAGIFLFVEMADDRLKNAADVKRVARLPVLAAAGDFAQMSDAQKNRWAFRAWTSLQGRLSPSANHGLICGVTSASQGEGRSTWVNLLAQTAHQQGFRVLTIATRQASAFVETVGMNGDAEPKKDNWVGNSGNGNNDAKLNCPRCGQSIEYPENAAVNSFPCPECSEPISVPTKSEIPVRANHEAAVQKNFLTSPGEVTEKLMGSEPQPIVHIPLPGWVWNLERRKQWRDALRHWSGIENVVILVELPPASEPEAVLLGENLPNLIWLTASGKANALDTREQLETLRHARCKLAGAVLNRAPNSIFQKRFRRWLNYAAIMFALNFHFSILHAAQNSGLLTTVATNQITETNLSFSAVSSAQLAPWQKHFTLGAGDVLNFSLFGEPLLTQLSVPIDPDGRVSFLEAQNVQAAGLTIDELRAAMDDALAKYRRAPHVIITPVAFDSKKYFLLGSVEHEGVFTLNQPITIVEAVARAGGLQTAVQQRNLIDIADLQRAFLVRDGQRLPVDFEKLFADGDLSQNVPLAPGDYLYFPPADLKQIYVVGEVQTPGPAAYNPNLSALSAIAEEGGFTERAWKKKVLVIRGSLNHPQTFVLDTAAMLSARAPNFKLQPNDIVYVHYRPWVRAEELLDTAATAFVQSAVIVWTGIHAGPLITTPIIR